MPVSLIIIAGIAVGIFLLCLMLVKPRKHEADKFLVLYLAFFSLSQLYFYFEAQGMFQQTSWMLLGRGIYLLGGPLFFYYVYTLTTPQRIPIKLYLLTLLPFVAYCIHFLYYYWAGFEGEDVAVRNGLLYINGAVPITWGFFVLLLIISDPLYLLWFYSLLKKYRKQAIHSVSDFDTVNLRWLSVVFYLWAASIIIFLPILIFSIGQEWFGSAWITALLQLDYLAFIFLLGIYGFKQSAIFAVNEATVSEQPTPAPSYLRSGLTHQQAASYHTKLLAYMDSAKPYLDGELTAQALATQLQISTNHLSQVINQREGKNFFDFINGYRVEEVKRNMADGSNSNITLLAMALDSGFNSKSAFNAVFKKITGQTPTQYYKSLPRQ